MNVISVIGFIIGVVSFGILLSWPVRRRSQTLRLKKFSESLENRFHFTSKRSGYGIMYTGTIGNYSCTIDIYPRFRHGPTSSGSTYTGDTVSITLMCQNKTRLIIGNTPSTSTTEAIDKRWSKHPMRPVLVSDDRFEKYTLKSIDPSWSQQLLHEDTTRDAVLNLFPKHAGITTLHVLPEVIWWKTYMALRDINNDHWQNWLQSLETFGNAITNQSPPTITDATTQMERNWIMNPDHAKQRARLYGFSCLGLLLLGIGGAIILILKVEGQL